MFTVKKNPYTLQYVLYNLLYPTNDSRINVPLALKNRALKMCLSNMPVLSNTTAHFLHWRFTIGCNLIVGITENPLVNGSAPVLLFNSSIILCLHIVKYLVWFGEVNLKPNASRNKNKNKKSLQYERAIQWRNK